MKDIRCPDCGYRLKSSECPICGKRVPIPVGAIQQKQYTQPQQNTYSPGTSRRRRKAGKLPAFLKTILIMFFVFFVGVPLLFLAVDEIFFTDTYEDSYEESDAAEEYQVAGTGDAAELPSMDPQILYEGEGLKVTAESIGLRYDSPTVLITVENSTDRTVGVSSDSVVVNGYMMSTAGFYRETEPGKTEQTYLTLESDDLSLCGIDTVAEISMGIMAYDSKDYSTIVPLQRVELRTAAYGLKQPVDDRGLLLWEADGVRLLFRQARVSSYDTGTMIFFVENMSERSVSIRSEAVYLNGKEADTMLWCYLRPSTRMVDTVYLFDLEEIGVGGMEDLKEIKLDLRIQNEEDWEEEYVTVSIPISS